MLPPLLLTMPWTAMPEIVVPSALIVPVIGRLPSPLETKPLNCVAELAFVASFSVESNIVAPKCALPLSAVPDCEMRIV